MRFTLVLLTILLSTTALYAEDPITIATWNVGLIDRSVSDLDLAGFANEIDADILFLNEVKRIEDLQAIRAALGRPDDMIAISSFESGDGNLEVGIISRYPITEVIEFDHSPEAFQVIPQQRQLERPDLQGIATVGVGRGFLSVRIPTLNMFVIGTHLKSSRGKSGLEDHSNAQKRELVTAAIATHVNELQEDHSEATIFVLGDANVGVNDNKKNGSDLAVDTFEGSGDKYDETHALLGAGLIDGLAMTHLSKGLAGTYVGNDDIPDYASAGAIDVIYAVGPQTQLFHNARRASTRYGSDHLAVYTSTAELAPDATEPPAAPATIFIRGVLPNPAGKDAGNETITLQNDGPETSISGWRFRDAAGNSFVIPNDTILAEGATTLTLTENTMPLNNNGDTIRLFDDQGSQIGPPFSYAKQEVNVGESIEH